MVLTWCISGAILALLRNAVQFIHCSAPFYVLVIGSVVRITIAFYADIESAHSLGLQLCLRFADDDLLWLCGAHFNWLSNSKLILTWCKKVFQFLFFNRDSEMGWKFLQCLIFSHQLWSQNVKPRTNAQIRSQIRSQIGVLFCHSFLVLSLISRPSIGRTIEYYIGSLITRNDNWKYI